VTTFLDGDRAYAGETDDRGIYRIAGLTRGRYVVGVIGRSVEAPTAEGVRQVYPTVYYPQSPAAGTSTPVVVESGGDVTNIDLSLPQPKRAAGLRGHVVPPGASAHVALNGLLVKLMAADAMDDGEEPIATVAADAAGAFVFDRLAEGDYVIDVAVAFPTRTVSRPSGIPQVARPSSQPRRPLRNVVLAFGSDGVTSTFVEPQATAGSGYWARQRVSVSAASRDDVAVMLNEGATVAGRVDYDSEHARAAFLRHPLPAVALEPDGLLAAVDAETGVFAVDGVRPGIHRLRVLQPGVAIMAVAGHAPDDPDAAIDTRGGRDVDVSVTVTDRLAVVSGLVKAPLAQLEAGATVVYTRADAAWAGHQQIGRIPVDTRGVYTASREPLVAGRYHFLALPSRDVAQWTNDGLLDETLTKRGTIVTIGWGEQRMINLDLTSLAPSQ
jgi:hypothetical protein